jgi:hypothetical protein
MVEQVLLPATLEQDLNWTVAMEEAERHVAAGKKILWHFELGLTRADFPIGDELTFQGLSLGLKRFSEVVFPRFQQATLGAILFKGSLDLRKGHFDNMLVALESYANYFHLLSAKLPDELVLYCLFDSKGIPRAQALHLLSQQCLRAFELSLQKETLPWLGVSLPEESFRTPQVLEEFELLLQAIEAKAIPYRTISEEVLTEQWDGCDAIAVLSSAVSPRGKRSLMGFCASGGWVVTQGDLLGLSHEIQLQDLQEDFKE